MFKPIQHRRRWKGTPMYGKVSVALLAGNLAGAALYLIVSSYSWALPNERGLNSTTGEPFIWALGALPVFAAFSLLNLIWGVAIAAGKRWRTGRLWIAAGCIWVVAAYIDFAHH